MIKSRKYWTGFLFVFFLVFFSFGLISCESDNHEAEVEEEENIEVENKLQLNVATYNMRRYGSEDSEERLWVNREEYVKKIIVKYDFDLFGTQECKENQISDLLELGDYAFIGVGRDDGESSGEYSAIFYKKNKFELLDQGHYWLSETPDIPSWGWGASSLRICSWGKFKEIETSTIFFFFNAHYQGGSTSGIGSTTLMLSKICAIAGEDPVFFTGDLNGLPSEEFIKMITASGKFRDSRLVSVYPPALATEGTANSWSLDGTTTNRIDYIFVSETMIVKQYSVINDDIELGIFSSDHFPVLINVGF